MTSAKLKENRDEFTESIDAYIDAYKDFQRKIKIMNSKIVDFDDKMLVTGILEQNEELQKKIEKLLGDLKNCKISVINSVNAKIIELMEEERKELQKEKE